MRGTGAAEAEGAGDRPCEHRSNTRGTLARELARGVRAIPGDRIAHA